MRKSRYIFLLWLCFFPALISGQGKKTDSLKLALGQAKNDIGKAQLYNILADEYKTTDPKSTLQYANKALVLASKIKYKLEVGNAYNNIGTAYIVLGNYAAALENFSKAQVIFNRETGRASEDALAVRNGLAKSFGSIGIVFSEQSNYAKALEFQLKALKIYEETKNEEKCARLYNNIGVIYKSQHEDFKALQYFLKCLKIQEKTAAPNIATTTTNIGNIYLNQKNFPKAFDHYTKAQQWFDKCPNARGLGELQNNLGLYYQQTGNPAKALESFQKAVTAFDSIGDQFGMADTYYYIAKLYAGQQNWPTALEATNKSLALAKKIGVVEQVLNAEQLLSEIYEKQRNPAAALQHFKLYVQAKDSVQNAENIRNGVRAEMNFEFDKKQAIQKKEQEKTALLYSEQSKRHQMQLFFILLFVVLLCGIAFLFHNRWYLKKTLTLQKELAEYEQKALHLQMNPHFVFNCLGSISSFIVQNGTDSAIKYLSKFSKLMRLTLEYSKESLIPIDKEIESLQNYLELEQLRFNQKFDFSITKSPDIEDDTALPPLLLQPFVENSIIHGLIPKNERGKIAIHFSIHDDNLRCTIKDDGIGFDTSKALKEPLVSVHKSMALDITRKRLEMMEASTSQKANVRIEELKNEKGEILGTKVVLNLPVQFISTLKEQV